MHLVPTGFPGHLSGYRFFSGTAPRSPIGLEEIERALLCRLALDPDQLLDDVINRFESGKTVLGDDAVAGRSAFFSIALGFVCLAIFSPSGGIFSPGAPPNQRNGPRDRVSGSKNIQRIQAEGRSISLTWAVTSDRCAPR
jgi:hypothetical protein